MNDAKQKNPAHVIDILFVLALFCIFTSASLIVVFIGADVYRSTITRMDTSFEINTSLMFLATNVRKHDATFIDSIQGQPALVLQQDINGQIFETWLYHHNGFINEFFIHSENRDALNLYFGQPIIEVYSFNMEMVTNELLALYASTQEGIGGRTLIHLRNN